MKATELISNAIAKGARVEYARNDVLVDLYGDKKIGIRFRNQNTYHWFKIWKDDNTVHFDHSYSMNTGKAHRGLKHRMRIQESLGFYDDIIRNK